MTEPAAPSSPSPSSPGPSFPPSLGTSEGTTITLLGRDLASELMGEVSFGELAYWLITLERPTPQQARDTGRFLGEVLAGLDEHPADADGWDEVALTAVRRQREAGRFVPGLGHPVHKDGDPRPPRLVAIAHEEDLYGPHLALFEAIGRVHQQVLGRRLPLNGAGVSGAALADLGIPQQLLRGTVLLARCAGLLGHIAEEIRRPVANDVYMSVDRNAVYVDPAEEG